MAGAKYSNYRSLSILVVTDHPPLTYVRLSENITRHDAGTKSASASRAGAVLGDT
jgi:hypothetical protein